jgi:hypothetical protein
MFKQLEANVCEDTINEIKFDTFIEYIILDYDNNNDNIQEIIKLGMNSKSLITYRIIKFVGICDDFMSKLKSSDYIVNTMHIIVCHDHTDKMMNSLYILNSNEYNCSDFKHDQLKCQHPSLIEFFTDYILSKYDEYTEEHNADAHNTDKYQYKFMMISDTVLDKGHREYIQSLLYITNPNVDFFSCPYLLCNNDDDRQDSDLQNDNEYMSSMTFDTDMNMKTNQEYRICNFKYDNTANINVNEFILLDKFWDFIPPPQSNHRHRFISKIKYHKGHSIGDDVHVHGENLNDTSMSDENQYRPLYKFVDRYVAPWIYVGNTYRCNFNVFMTNIENFKLRPKSVYKDVSNVLKVDPASVDYINMVKSSLFGPPKPSTHSNEYLDEYIKIRKEDLQRYGYNLLNFKEVKKDESFDIYRDGG